jgi:hypothetical protein
MLVKQISINPSASGEYQVNPNFGDLMDDADILNSVDGDLYRLGVDDLPDNVEDITGKIHDEPDQVYAVVSEHGVSYFGLVNY